MPSYVLTTPPARRSTFEWHLRRWALALTAALLAVLGIVTPAYAEGVADISKALDTTQGAGFTAPNTFQSGALVRYRITLSCSSNTSDCGVGKFSDVLEPGLVPVDVVLPTTTLPLSKSISGQTVSVTIGTTAAPWPDSSTLELVVVARVTGTRVGTIPNTGTITTHSETANPVTTTSPIVNIVVPKPTPDWGLSKTASPTSIAAGETVRFNIRFTVPTPLGNVPVTGGTLVDTFPAGAVILKGATPIPDGGTTADGGVVDYTTHTITWPIPAMDPANSNCSTNPCNVTAWSPQQVIMNFPADIFPGGTTVTNRVLADLTFADGTTGNPAASANVAIVGAAPQGSISKDGPTSVVAGERLSYLLRAINGGNVTATNWSIVDRLPEGLTVLTLGRGYGPVWNNSSGVPDSKVTYEWSTDGATWTTFFTYTPGVPWTGSVAIPSGAKFIRATAASLAPNGWLDVSIAANVAADTPVGTVLRNCADLVGSDIPTATSCVDTTVLAPFSQIKVYKGATYPDSAVTSIRPGDPVTFWINVRKVRGVSLTTIDFVDELPAGFEWVSTECFYLQPTDYDYGSTSYSGVGACDNTQTASTTPQITKNADGSSTLKWLGVVPPASAQAGTAYYGIRYTARALPGTAVANYTNKVYISNADVATTCLAQYGYSTPVTDTSDMNGDGSTSDVFCLGQIDVQVREAAIADVFKWVKGDLGLNALESTGQPSATCPELDGYTRYPCVAEVSRGGAFDYLFQHVNTGNIPMADFVMYDILPHVGDTGVNQVLAGSPRNTVWTPVLTGPVTLAPATIPAGANPSILYSLSYDPCRPELAQGTPGTNWQGAACTDPIGGTNIQNTWYPASAITDWTTVKSFKIVMFDGVRDQAAAWQPGAEIVANAPMQAPAAAPESTQSPLALSVAWNSIAHQEARLNANGTIDPLLSAAPRKVGIIVPFPGVSVGDYVWMDSNRDGLQSPGEAPIAGVTVKLLDSTGAVLSTTTTDADGYYSFRYLQPSTEYTIEFVSPADLKLTTPNAAGTTSNDPTADNGTTPLDGTTGGDSDAIPTADGTSGSVTFTTPAMSGTSNLASDPAAGTVSDNPGLDAGFVSARNLVSIGDYVWYDVNRDGLQDSTDTPIADVTVELYEADGSTLVATDTTDASGHYSFVDLNPDTTYVVKFIKPSGATFTLQDASGIATNGATDDLTDSDPNADGTVTVTTPSSGTDMGDPDKADNHGIDAGFVALNLTLAKALTSAGPYHKGSTAVFTLTPHNDGPVDAIKGWSVTDLLPTGLTLVSIAGADSPSTYSCDASTLTCTSSVNLPAGADAEAIVVTVTVDTNETTSLHNVAYVSPAQGEVTESNPLETPTSSTDTSTTDTDNDAQAELAIGALVSIGDYVWYDVNRDGLQTAGEPVVPGVVVNLYAADGTSLIASTTTGPDGYYSFKDLAPSTDYVVEFIKPAGTTFTTQEAGDTAADSNADVVSGRASVTTPAGGNNAVGANVADDPTIDAGLVGYNLTLAKTITSSGPYYGGVSTVTYELLPHNDGPVAALAGWSVTDILPAGLTLVSMTGDPAAYTCSGAVCTSTQMLAPKADGLPITVTAKVDANFTGTAKNVAYVAPVDGDVDETNPLGDVPTTDTDTGTSPTDNDDEQPITVGSLVSIGDYVWFDTNRDGMQSDTEAPVEGVKVTLTDASGNVVETMTDAHGFYSFVDLVPGAAYTLTFTAPDGTTWTTQDAADSTNANDSDVDPATGNVSVTAPASGTNSATTPDDPTFDGGLVKLNLTLAKALTTSGPYHLGSTAVFSLTPHNEGPVDALKGWSVTDVLPEGLTLVSMTGPTYTCDVATATCVSSVSLPAGADGQAIEVTAKVTTKTKAVMHNVAYVSPSADEITETNTLVIPKTATDTSSTATDNDAQADLSTESLVSIGDYVWFDTNRDGLQSTGEPVVPGVVVNLYAEDGVTLVSSTTTDEHGFYSFVDLIPGATYVVEFVKPSGSTFTTPTAGDTAADSNADLVTGRVTVVAPAEGNNSASEPDDPTIDAGLVQLNLTLTKTLTSDANVHPGDTVTYSLVPHNDGPVDALAGWSISEVLPAGLTLTDLSGTGYTCSVASATCISTAVLPANADGPAVTVTATVNAGFTGEARNIAYVAPSPDDEDETNPLVIPDTDTDTTASPTDNDAEAPVTVTEERLAHTGADGLQQFALIGGLLFALGALVLLTNRRRSRSL